MKVLILTTLLFAPTAFADSLAPYEDSDWYCEEEFIGKDGEISPIGGPCPGNAYWACYGTWRNICKEQNTGETRTYTSRRLLSCSDSNYSCF
jgi:hypothetical protein